MPNEDIRAVSPLSPAERRANQQLRSQLGYEYIGEIVSVNGQYTDGSYVWVRRLGGTTSGGVTIKGITSKVLAPTDSTIVAVGRKVKVFKNDENQLQIKGNLLQDLIDANININQLNPINPRRKYITLEQISNFNSFPDPNDSNDVMIYPGIYRKPDGSYGNYAGETGFEILTTYKPGTSETQVVVCLWLDVSSGTVTATASSELTQDTDLKTNPDSGITLINECADSAPSGSIGLWSWIVKSDDTAITVNNKYRDLRGIINSGTSTSTIDLIMTTPDAGIMVDANGNVMYGA